MITCKKLHRNSDSFLELPHDQGGVGRHKCAGCAYDRGYESGKKREETIKMDLDSLPDSQAGSVRHKSPHAAFAQGYHDGVKESYNTE